MSTERKPMATYVARTGTLTLNLGHGMTVWKGYLREMPNIDSLGVGGRRWRVGLTWRTGRVQNVSLSPSQATTLFRLFGALDLLLEREVSIDADAELRWFWPEEGT